MLVDDRQPERLRGSRRGLLQDWPPISTMPGSGSVEPAATAISVDLPAPFSPTSAWTSPSTTSRPTPLSATTPGIRLDDVREAENDAGCRHAAYDGFPYFAIVRLRELVGGVEVGRGTRHARPGPDRSSVSSKNGSVVDARLLVRAAPRPRRSPCGPRSGRASCATRSSRAGTAGCSRAPSCRGTRARWRRASRSARACGRPPGTRASRRGRPCRSWR